MVMHYEKFHVAFSQPGHHKDNIVDFDNAREIQKGRVGRPNRRWTFLT
jgi:hypothetical protein